MAFTPIDPYGADVLARDPHRDAPGAPNPRSRQVHVEIGMVLEEFGPTDTARAGILLDHMVAGSKETRIARAVQERWGESVLVLGHPFVDIWQAVKPGRVGLEAWPQIPRGTDIKHGTLEYLGWPYATRADIAAGWRRILSTVRNYRDLEPALLGRVEELIDFVTVPWAH